MKDWKKITLASFGLIGTSIGLALWSGSSNWKSETADLVEKLEESASSIKSQTLTYKDLETLPSPVAKYFQLVLKEGQQTIRTAQIGQTGEFFLNKNWIPFEATQHFSINPAGFVWDANMQMNPLLNVHVRDSFVEGEGAMTAKILSLIPVMNASGNQELNAGSLQRYLAEAIWLPTALLPSENLVWSGIDENRALATLAESGTTVSLEFRFNEAGEITEVFSPARFREVKGEYVLTPWLGRFWNYKERSGMLIPTEAEVEWQLRTENMPYWKGKVLNADYK